MNSLDPRQVRCGRCGVHSSLSLLRCEGCGASRVAQAEANEPQCSEHPGRLAAQACPTCGGFRCPTCLHFDLEGAAVCRRCARKQPELVREPHATKLGFGAGAVFRSLVFPRQVLREIASGARRAPGLRVLVGLWVAASLPAALWFGALGRDPVGGPLTAEDRWELTLGYPFAVGFAIVCWAALLPWLDALVLWGLGGRTGRRSAGFFEAAAFSLAPLALVVPIWSCAVSIVWALVLRVLAMRYLLRLDWFESVGLLLLPLALVAAAFFGFRLDQ